MKKAFATLFALIAITCYSLKGQAADTASQHVSACLLGLPPVVLISQDMRDLNFSKSPLVDAFWDFESTQRGGDIPINMKMLFAKRKFLFIPTIKAV